MRGMSITKLAAVLIGTTLVIFGCEQAPSSSGQSGSQSNTNGSKPAAPAANTSQPSSEDLSALRTMVKGDEKPAADSSTAALPPGHPPIPGRGASGSGAVAPPPAASASDLKFEAPVDWKPVPPPSAMRKAQYAIPHVEGDSEDGEVVLFYFGPGEGGATADNLARWRGQFTTADGGALPADASKEEKLDAGGLKVTLLDVSGRFAPGAMPGMQATGPRDNYRMLAAVIETPHGPWFVKVTGPANTIEKNRDAIRTFITSAKQ